MHSLFCILIIFAPRQGHSLGNRSLFKFSVIFTKG